MADCSGLKLLMQCGKFIGGFPPKPTIFTVAPMASPWAWRPSAQTVAACCLRPTPRAASPAQAASHHRRAVPLLSVADAERMSPGMPVLRRCAICRGSQHLASQRLVFARAPCWLRFTSTGSGAGGLHKCNRGRRADKEPFNQNSSERNSACLSVMPALVPARAPAFACSSSRHACLRDALRNSTRYLLPTTR
jgi:hypothetical protein